MRKTLQLGLLLALVLPFTAQRAEAQFSFIPYLGYNLDAEKLLIGVGTEFDFPVAAPVDLGIRPAVEYMFVDDMTWLQINGDVIARFGSNPSLKPYAGAGLAILYTSFDCEGPSEFCDMIDTSNTDVGLNLLGGAQFGTGFAQPFVQGRFTMKDGSAFSILGGVVLAL